MIEIKNKQIIIDGKPQIIMCGEIHYYRLERNEWQDRLDKLKQAGCNAVATYAPWILHEPVEGEVDLQGRTRPELNLEAYIDLCQENGLYFFLRPGPFIMAEMKNEGLPYWVYKKHPKIIPTGWDGNPATTPTVDYNAPEFLKEVRKWYESLMKVVKPRLHTNGGNIIGFQLDNEIGMLSWVSNCPDLTDFVLDDFSKWLASRYDGEELNTRYPFDLTITEIRNCAIRSPKEEYASELMKDLGYYMRHRFARYVDTLRGFAEEFGVKDIPFVVNIHGTGGGRGFTFPIGISQLYESYTQAPGYLSGSDIYFGDLDIKTFQDLYLINGFMDAVHNPDQPLTSVEFNCGDGNFGDNFGERYDVSAADFKTRMCVAQGNRLLNYYLFAGGRNSRLETKVDDGNDRFATTGERHGFAAPVSPEGELNYTFPRMARAIKTMMAVSDKLATMDEERDDVSFTFIPDYYMTEYRYPKSERVKEIISNIEEHRSSGSWEIMAKSMLLSGYRFGAVDIQNKPLSATKTPVLALPSARYMDSAIQKKLVDYMQDGGCIFLYGEVPQYDMEGKECTILADAFGVKSKGTLRNSQEFFLSLYADNWAAPRPEVRSHFAQVFEIRNAVPLLKVYGTDEVSSFDVGVGKGRAIVMANAYACDIKLFKEGFEKLGAKAKLTHDCKDHGIFMTSTSNDQGERFIHILNLDGFDKDLKVYENSEVLFGGKTLTIQSKDGIMLPINLLLNLGKIVYSTAEITNINEGSIEFRLTQAQDVIAFETSKEIVPNDNYSIEKIGDLTIVKSSKHAKIDDSLTIYFE